MQRVKTTQDLELKERLVAVNRVTKVTKGGRTFTFAAIVECLFSRVLSLTSSSLSSAARRYISNPLRMVPE